MNPEATAKFTLNKPRYDQDEYKGRLRHFLDMIDPRTLFVGESELNEATDLLKQYETGKLPAGVTDDDLWAAKKKRDSIIHPVTQEPMFLPGRMSAFVPMNVPIAYGMLTMSDTPLRTVFWQWMNQSYNVVNNYTNRSGADVDMPELMKAYGAAVGVSCSIAVAAGHLVNNGPPIFKAMGLFVPYFAVICAGSSNVAFTRMEEVNKGVPILDSAGNQLGISKVAGFEGVKNTVLSRSCFLPIFPLVLPPLIMSAAHRMKAVRTSRPIALAVELMAITACMSMGLPAAIAIFPQNMSIAVTSLEPEFQGLMDKDGNRLEHVFYNKGL
jgi:tricarboxylate carrier